MDIVLHHQEVFLSLLSDLLLFFGISGVLVPVLQRIHLSPVLGYLLCGVIIGPYGIALFADQYHWIEVFSIGDQSTVQILGELGIMALLFMIGLELSLRRLMELKRYVLGLGSSQIIVTGAIIAVIAAIFDNKPEAALLLGASLALSSTAIVMQLLDEKHLSNRPVGVVCFSILLMQDLAVVPILIMVSAFSGQSDQSVWYVLLESLLMAIVTVMGIYIFGKKLLRPLMRSIRFTHNAEWLAAFVLFLIAAIAMLTQMAGLSAALGAFLAGLLISETEYRHEVEVIVEPLKNLLLGIFFLSIGMMIDVREILHNPYWIAASVIGIFCVKSLILYPLARIFGVENNQAIQLAVKLSQPGEFAFLILSFALISELIPKEDVQFFFLVTAVAMFISPLVFNAVPAIARLLTGRIAEAAEVSHLRGEEEQHIIIVGFGRIGMMIGAVLEKQKIPFVAIDSDPNLVSHAKSQDWNVIFGDARRTAQWKNMQVENATAVILAIDDPETAKDILAHVRYNWPHLSIFIRASDVQVMRELYDMGAKKVVPEALESSLQLARGVMEHIGISGEAIDDAVNHVRNTATLNMDAFDELVGAEGLEPPTKAL